MADFTETYAEQNRILDIYLKNAGIGTVVIEVNNQVIGMHICEYLHTYYHLHLIDDAKLSGGIVNFLRETGRSPVAGDRRVCIYNFPTDADTIDVVRSLNISRELLRSIDRLVLVMPTIFVEQIRIREPNLRDYFGLFLDYNRPVSSPFEPIFDVPFKKRFTREERKKLKGAFLSLDINESLRQYFQYISQFYHRRLSKHECYQVLLPAFERLLAEMHDYYGNDQLNYIQATEDILYQTATVLAVQRYTEPALEQFEMMLDIVKRNITEKVMYALHALEGIAYCFYCMRNYQKSEEALIQAIQLLQKMETDHVAWICRLYSNYAACHICMREWQNAEEVLNRCIQVLVDNGKMNSEREARIRTNLMICKIEQGKVAEIATSEWQQYAYKIKSEPVKGYDYANSILLDAWYKGVLLGCNREALSEARTALKINRELLEENAYELAVNYAVLETIYGQLGDVKNENLAKKKKENILRAKNDRL